MLAGARVDDRVLAMGALGIGCRRATEAMTVPTATSSSSPFAPYEPR